MKDRISYSNREEGATAKAIPSLRNLKLIQFLKLSNMEGTNAANVKNSFTTNLI
jgi:hypothetical protein